MNSFMLSPLYTQEKTQVPNEQNSEWSAQPVCITELQCITVDLKVYSGMCSTVSMLIQNDRDSNYKLQQKL